MVYFPAGRVICVGDLVTLPARPRYPKKQLIDLHNRMLRVIDRSRPVELLALREVSFCFVKHLLIPAGAVLHLGRREVLGRKAAVEFL